MDTAYLIDRWHNVRAGLNATIDKFSDEDLAFRPYPGAWSVQQVLLHIAQEENGEFNFGYTGRLGDFLGEYDPAHYPSLAAINALLGQVHGETIAYLGALPEEELHRPFTTPWGAQMTPGGLVDHLIEHEVHHRGELSLILGMLGRVGFDT
jgi:uncharacterized damage-inducible protein DinB